MPNLKINDIIIGKRHRKDLGDIAGLAKSIQKNLLHPPIVTDRNELVAGFRRIKAAELLGWIEIEVRVINPDDMLEAEHDENECRKDFTPSERVAIAESIKQRLEQGGQLATGEKARDKASQAAGFSSTTDYRRTKEVVEKGVPELVDALDKGQVSASAAATVAGLPKAEQREVVKAKTVAEAAKERMEALAREKQRRRWIDLIGTSSKTLKKKILADPDKFTDEMLLKSLPPCCANCLRKGPPTRPCDDCELLRKPSLIPEEGDGPIPSPLKAKTGKIPAEQLKADTIKLQAAFTRMIKEKGDFPERLLRFLTVNGLIDYKDGPVFLALKGVPCLIEKAMIDEPYSDHAIREMFKKACGAVEFVPERTKFIRGKKKKRRPT